MSQIVWDESLTSRLRVMQIIIFALTMGCVMFLGVLLVIGNGGDNANPRGGDAPGMIITCVAIGFCLAMFAARAIVPGIIESIGRRQIVSSSSAAAADTAHRTTELIQLFQTRMIVGGAIFEAAAFFSLVAYLVERRWAALAAGIVMILCIAAHFPTRDRLLAWINEQSRLIDDELALRRP